MNIFGVISAAVARVNKTSESLPQYSIYRGKSNLISSINPDLSSEISFDLKSRHLALFSSAIFLISLQSVETKISDKNSIFCKFLIT